MKALTVRQPWASMLVSGAKRVEYRTWSTDHRGPLAIHAGLKRDRAPFDAPGDDVTGAIIGVVNVVDVVAGPPHGYAWIVEPMYALGDPLPMHGQQGFFDVDVPQREGVDRVRYPDRRRPSRKKEPGPTS